MRMVNVKGESAVNGGKCTIEKMSPRPRTVTIFDKIHQNVIFHSGSNNSQLPVSIQLAIFLNHAGHYRNVISPEDVAQWAGVSIGSVVNCTHHVMIALLSCHNEYIVVPPVDSEDAELSHTFIEERTCPGWQNGIFATDGSTIPLFQKPATMGRHSTIGNQHTH